MLILLIGPAGIGKSYLSKEYARHCNKNIEIRELDKLVRDKSGIELSELIKKPDGRKQLWDYGHKILKQKHTECKGAEKVCICDCGVGFLYTEQGRKHFLQYEKKVTLLDCPWKSYQRKIKKIGEYKKGDNYYKYLENEFNGDRWEVYSSSYPNIIDITGFEFPSFMTIDKFTKDLNICIERLRGKKG